MVKKFLFSAELNVTNVAQNTELFFYDVFFSMCHVS
jgi:hypothetical protein